MKSLRSIATGIVLVPTAALWANEIPLSTPLSPVVTIIHEDDSNTVPTDTHGQTEEPSDTGSSLENLPVDEGPNQQNPNVEPEQNQQNLAIDSVPNEQDLPTASSSTQNPGGISQSETEVPDQQIPINITQPIPTPIVDIQDSGFPTQRSQLISEIPEPDLDHPPLFEPRLTEHGTLVTRITSNGMFNSDDGDARHNYSVRQVWNVDETIMDIADNFVDAETYNIIGSVPLTTERAWSNTNPDIMYGMRYGSSGSLNEFVAHNISTDITTVVKRLDEYSRCYMGNGNGNLSNDDQYILFSCKEDSRDDVYTLISYDIFNDNILGIREANPGYDWAGFSHSGNYIVVDESNGPDPDRLVRYDKYLENEKTLFDDPGHSDIGVDAEGDDIVIRIRWDYFVYFKLSTGERVDIPISDSRDNIVGGGHISCRAIFRPGWCYASTYSPDRIVAIKLSGDPAIAVTETWGHHASDHRSGGYRAQPQVTVSPSGRQLIYASNLKDTAEINAYRISIE